MSKTSMQDKVAKLLRQAEDVVGTPEEAVFQAKAFEPEGTHRHFGYWIDRDGGRARCYGCGFQFAGTEDTAEDWRLA